MLGRFLTIISVACIFLSIAYVYKGREETNPSANPMSHEREKCVFCRIFDGKEPTDILYQDDLYMVFPDIKPAAEHHYLVITKQHIPNSKHLKSAEDKVIVSDLVRIGKQVLQDRTNITEAILGFHWPPFNSISHLHLHIIAPANSLSFISRAIFRPDSWWFVTPEYVTSRL